MLIFIWGCFSISVLFINFVDYPLLVKESGYKKANIFITLALVNMFIFIYYVVWLYNSKGV